MTWKVTPLVVVSPVALVTVRLCGPAGGLLPLIETSMGRSLHEVVDSWPPTPLIRTAPEPLVAPKPWPSMVSVMVLPWLVLMYGLLTAISWGVVIFGAQIAGTVNCAPGPSRLMTALVGAVSAGVTIPGQALKLAAIVR